MFSGQAQNISCKIQDETEGTAMNKRKFGIKSKLLGILIPVVAGMIAVIIFNIYHSTSAIIINQSENLLETKTESVVNKVTAWMNETLTALDMERDTIEFYSMEEDAQMDYIRHTVNRYDSFPAGIYLASINGSLYHASFRPGPEYSVFEKDWYKDGLLSEEFVFGAIYFDEDSQSYVVGASGMLKDKNGNVKGVAAADIYLNAISEIVADVRVEQTGAMFLVESGSNMIIGHGEPSMLGIYLNDLPNSMYSYAGDLIRNQSYGLQSYVEADGNEIYLQIEQVPNSKWVTVAYVPHEEVVSDLNALTSKMIAISVCGVLLLIILMERFIHVIIKPVKKLNKVINAMSEGDFTVDIQVRTSDEIGVMADSVHRFIRVMRDILKQISEVTILLNEQSVNSTQVAGSLSQASGLQASSMNDMTRTVDELTRSIMELAESASLLSALSNDAKEGGAAAEIQMETAVNASTLGRQEMGHLLDSMKDISQRVDQLEKTSQEMGTAIEQVNSMVDFIRDIADETNLLSLNASIEAARAGEAGRGFAIVAGQIGKLALNSKSAAEEISGLTTQINSLALESAGETRDSIIAINAGSRMVAQTETAFRNIYDVVNETDQAVRTMIRKVEEVNEIAVSLAGITQEQSASSEEILASVESMRENAGEVSDNSRTVANDAVSLQTNASRLKEQLELFRIQ